MNNQATKNFASDPNKGKKGKFIVLEGVDGSGISTQTAFLKAWLTDHEPVLGRSFFTKEPTDGPVGGLIRLALSKRLKPLDERIMALLFAADRLDHLYCTDQEAQREGIHSMLDKGIHVVSDRYILSTLAYQSLHVDLAWLRQLNRYSLRPDLTILLHVPITESAQRRNQSRFHEELYEREDVLTKISANYLQIAETLQEEGYPILIINGVQPRDAVSAEITTAIQALFT